MQKVRVTICACISRSFIHKENVAAIAATMKNEGYHVVVEADLCKKIMEASPELPDIAAGVILACHPRVIASHIDGLGLKAGHTEDIRTNGIEETLSHFDLSYSDTRDATEKDVFRKKIEELPVENGTDAWYPVIDKNRCTDCGKCHDFCLFGVYTIENKRVKVLQPQNCKNNCPACARMCPSKAIIFPKYEKSPINGGVADEEVFHPEEMDKMYRERLQMRLKQRRTNVPLLKNDKK